MESDRLATRWQPDDTQDRAYPGREAVQTDGTVSITQGSEAAMAINDRTTAKPGRNLARNLFG
jgi:hypothetical protein